MLFFPFSPNEHEECAYLNLKRDGKGIPGLTNIKIKSTPPGMLKFWWVIENSVSHGL
jgi:hypothetical protein